MTSLATILCIDVPQSNIAIIVGTIDPADSIILHVIGLTNIRAAAVLNITVQGLCLRSKPFNN